MYTHSFLESANVGNCRNVNKRIELMFVRETDLQNVTELSDVWKSDQKKIFGIFQVWSTYWIGGAAWSPDYLLLCGGNELSVGRRQGSGGFGVIFNNKIVPDWTENSKKKRKTSHECETALTSQSLTLFLVFAFCLFGCISRKKEKNYCTIVCIYVFPYFAKQENLVCDIRCRLLAAQNFSQLACHDMRSEEEGNTWRKTQQ